MPSIAGASSQRLLEPDTFLTRDRAAEALAAAGIPTTKATLEQLAVRHAGPPYTVVNGRAIYSRHALHEWIESRTKQPSAA